MLSNSDDIKMKNWLIEENNEDLDENNEDLEENSMNDQVLIKLTLKQLAFRLSSILSCSQFIINSTFYLLFILIFIHKNERIKKKTSN